MDIQWRVIQLFLGEEGISEVSVATQNNRKVKCTCEWFSSSGRCKHTRFVRNKIVEQNGVYTVQLQRSADEDALNDEAMMEDMDLWKEFIYRHGSVEVI